MANWLGAIQDQFGDIGSAIKAFTGMFTSGTRATTTVIRAAGEVDRADAFNFDSNTREQIAQQRNRGATLQNAGDAARAGQVLASMPGFPSAVQQGVTGTRTVANATGDSGAGWGNSIFRFFTAPLRWIGLMDDDSAPTQVAAAQPQGVPPQGTSVVQPQSAGVAPAPLGTGQTQSFLGNGQPQVGSLPSPQTPAVQQSPIAGLTF